MTEIEKEILNELETKRVRLFEVRTKGNRSLNRRHIQLTEKIDEMTRKRMRPGSKRQHGK